MPRAVIALGSNLGDREAFLDFAVSALSRLAGTRVLRVARRRETAPVGVPPEFAGLTFLNSAVLVETALGPLALLAELHRIEAEAGRVRTVRNGPRPLDLDIVLYEGVACDTPELTLPHPRAAPPPIVRGTLAGLGIAAARLRRALGPKPR